MPTADSRNLISAFAFALLLAACGEPSSMGAGGGTTGVGGGTVAGGSGGGTGSSGGTGGFGGPGVNKSELQSGSRLKAVIYKGADGSSHGYDPTGALFWDSMRAENCTIRQAADLKKRCLPVLGVGPEQTYYKDPGCSDANELIRVPKAAAPACVTVPGVIEPTAKYAVKWKGQSTTCGYASGASIHLKGPEFTGQIYRFSSGYCEAVNPDPDMKYFDFGIEVQPTEFVEFTPALL